MRTPPHRFEARRETAFTLLELLIVIMIIAILAGMIFALGPSVLDLGRKAQAKGTAMSILIAVQEYEAEYTRYPMEQQKQGYDTIFGNPGDDQLYSTKDFLDVLLANDEGWNSNHLLNPKRKVYLQIAPAKKRVGPEGETIYINGLGDDGRIYDPWGHEYLVMMDGDYDGRFAESWFQSNFVYDDSQFEAGTVIVWSYGRDGTMGTDGDKKLKGSDDVVTWR